MAEDFVSCARVDAKYVDRGSQMKYDIAKNEAGPLNRTMRKEITSGTIDPSVLVGSNGPLAETPLASAAPLKAGTKRAFSLVDDQRATSTQYPALSERLDNIEKHLALRYGISSQCPVIASDDLHSTLSAAYAALSDKVH